MTGLSGRAWLSPRHDWRDRSDASSSFCRPAGNHDWAAADGPQKKTIWVESHPAARRLL